MGVYRGEGIYIVVIVVVVVIATDIYGVGSGADMVSLPVRNLLLHCLARLLGPENASSFVRLLFLTIYPP